MNSNERRAVKLIPKSKIKNVKLFLNEVDITSTLVNFYFKSVYNYFLIKKNLFFI